MLHLSFNSQTLCQAVLKEGIYGVVADTSVSAKALMLNILVLYKMDGILNVLECSRKHRNIMEFQFEVASDDISKDCFLQNLMELTSRLNKVSISD